VISKQMVQGGFPIKPLGEVVEFLDGQRRPIKALERVAGPYPYYGANGQQDSVADYIFDEPLILLAEDGGLFDQPDRGIAYLISGKSWVNNHAHVLRPRDSVELTFLIRVLENYDVTPWITGSTRAKLTKAGASRIQIPLPPLAEQKRIAAILDAADALRAKRRESIEQLDLLIQSIFLEMFGDPVTNPKGWEIAKLDSLCSGISDIDHKMPKAVDSGIPFISAKDLVDDGSISFKNVKQISKDDFNRLAKKGKPEKGDIVYSRIGAKLGKARLVEVDFDFLASYSCCTIKPTNELVDRRFLCYLLDSPYILRQARSDIRAIAVPDLGLGKIKAFKIITPPLGLQTRFASIVESIEKQKTQLKAHLAELDTLFASLQSRAFSGKLDA
jgi:type I restriction enzyme, S subunit